MSEKKCEFKCGECPIVEDYERRCQSAEEGGFEPQFEYCSCDKVQYKFYQGGHCEDAYFEEIQEPETKGSRKTGLRYRRRMNVKKRDELIKNVELGKTRAWIEHSYVDGEWKQTGKFVKHPKNSNKRKFMKKSMNRAVRRNPETFKGNQHRKLLGIWYWE